MSESNSKPRIRVPARSSRPKQSIIDYEKARGHRTDDAFQNYSLNLGLGTNNALSDSTYGFLPITRDRTLLEWIYRGSWIAGVAIDSVAEDMTREGIKITSVMDPGAIKDLNSLADYFGIWSAFNDTTAWGRLYGGALGVIMIDGQDPSTPLRMDAVGRSSFKGIMVFDRWMVEPNLERMVKGPADNSLVPESYLVITSGSGISFEGMRVHHSRVFRHEGIRLPYWQRIMENMWGISVLERLYDRLVAFDSATNGAAQLVYKSYLRTFSVENLREIIAAGGAAVANLEKYVEFMRRYQGIEGITLIDARDTFEGQGSAGTAFGGIADALVQFGQQISGGLQVPLTRLFGQSPAGMNATGESDMRNYYDSIHQRQERDMRNPVNKVYRVMCRSEGIQLPEDFSFDFPPLWQLQEEQKSNVAVQVVTAVQAAEEAGFISQQTAMKELKQSSDITGIFSNISEQDIEAADQEVTPPQVEGMPQPGMPGDPNAMADPNQQGMEGDPNQAQQGPEPGQEQAPAVGEEQGDAAPQNERLARGFKPVLGGSANPEQRARVLRIFQHTDQVLAPLRGRDMGPKRRNAPGRMMDFKGLPLYIETNKGDSRMPEWPPLTADYGYVRMTGSAEGPGEGLDCFVGDDKESDVVVVIDQHDPETGNFDEQKVFLGFPNRKAAIDCYSGSYTDAANRIGRVQVMDFNKFKQALESDSWRGKAA